MKIDDMKNIFCSFCMKVVREITYKKTYNCKINSGMCKFVWPLFAKFAFLIPIKAVHYFQTEDSIRCYSSKILFRLLGKYMLFSLNLAMKGDPLDFIKGK
jgi:hypothetical protein